MWQKTIQKTDSSISGKIQVVSFFGQPRIIVNNMIQSGGMVERIWKKGIEKILRYKDIKILRVLILGLGGGTVAKLINQKFPQAKITGIEIDPVMIKLGKKYFGLNKIKNLKIIQADAVHPRGGFRLLGGEKIKYDLIIVDLYIGDKIPKKSESVKILKKLKKILSKNGLIIFNRLFYKEHRIMTESFIKKLDKYFENIELVRAWSNLLVFTSR